MMAHQITMLPLIEVKSGIAYYAPDPLLAFVSENDPAEAVMTDFKKVTPITIEPVVGIDVALSKMKSLGVRLLFVTDEYDNISGVITSYDIQGEKPIKYSEQSGIDHNHIQVEMIKTPLEKMPAFDMEFVQQSVVRHVVTTMQELDSAHALIIETNNNTAKQTIRGMFSDTQISKMLGIDIYEPVHAAHSLADMQHELSH